MSLRTGKRVTAAVASAVPIVGAMAVKAFVDFQNGSIVTTEYEIKSRNVPKSLDGFRIVEVADLHDATFGFQNERLVQAVKDARPDLIVIAGDLIHKETIGNAMAFVRHATSLAPIVFAPGNHESYSPLYPELRRQLMQSGVFLLEDDIVTERELGLSRPAGGGLLHVPAITVIGMADPLFSPWLDRSEPDRLADRKLNELLPKAKEMEEPIGESGNRPFRILVSHRPEHFASYAREGIDLVLSGHAHGGQWRVPGLGGLYAPSQGILPKYVSGVHEEGNTKMVVSRGLGNSGFPLRLNNRPEVVVVTLRSDGKAPSPIDFRNRAGLTAATGEIATRIHDGIRDAVSGDLRVGDHAAGNDGNGGKGKKAKPKSATKEILKTAARDAAIQEAPHVMQEIIGALTPLVVSALVGKTFLSGKAK